jgi:hypothetical protein
MTESFGGGGGGGTGAAGPGAGGVAGFVTLGWVPLGGFGCRFFFLQTFFRRCFLRAAVASREDVFALCRLRFAGTQRDFLRLRLRRLAAVANSTLSYSAGMGLGMRETARLWTW